MPLIIPVIKKTIEAKAFAAYQKEFGSLQADNPAAAENWQKQAKIAGEIAGAIIEAIMLQAEVAPGIPVVTPTGPGATVGPGKIL